jgi:hypothetical protein
MAVGRVRSMRHGSCGVLGSAQGDPHSGIAADVDPLSIAWGDRGEVALSKPRDVRRPGDDGSIGREHAQRLELCMVVVEV